MRTSAEVSQIAFNCAANVLSEMCDGRLKAFLRLVMLGTSDRLRMSYASIPVVPHAWCHCRFPLSSAVTGVELHGGKVRGHRDRDFRHLPQTRPHIVRRADRASRLLQDRIRRTPEMAERKQLR